MRRDAFIMNYFRVWEMAIPSGKIINCTHGFPLEYSTSCQHYRGIWKAASNVCSCRFIFINVYLEISSGIIHLHKSWLSTVSTGTRTWHGSQHSRSYSLCIQHQAESLQTRYRIDAGQSRAEVCVCVGGNYLWQAETVTLQRSNKGKHTDPEKRADGISACLQT